MPLPEHTLSALLAVLAAILVLTQVMGHLVQRLGQPAVLGELLAGVFLGPSLLHWLDPRDPILFALGELGVLILLFQIGLHTDLRAILRLGAAAAMVGITGVVLPFAGGYVAAVALGFPEVTAIVCGAALTATSIGISARVLSDLGQLDTSEGLIVLGAAVFDDVIGLVMLSVVGALAAGGALDAAGVAKIGAMAVGFLAATLLVGSRVVPFLVRFFSHLRVPGAVGTLSLAFALLLGALAAESGSAMILGAFAAGLLLYPTPQARPIERAATTMGHFFVPVFFAVIGASVNLGALLDPTVLVTGALLAVVAVLGKLASGYAAWWHRGPKLMIGVSMIPRGEVGLIFAQMGLVTGALSQGLFSAVVLVVMVTTFVAPLWLGLLRRGGRPLDPDPRPSTLDP
jgi:Kef-type K+ transport system membrane component KefB